MPRASVWREAVKMQDFITSTCFHGFTRLWGTDHLVFAHFTTSSAPIRPRELHYPPCRSVKPNRLRNTYGAAHDSAQGVPRPFVKPVQELVEAVCGEMVRRSVVEPVKEEKEAVLSNPPKNKCIERTVGSGEFRLYRIATTTPTALTFQPNRDNSVGISEQKPVHSSGTWFYCNQGCVKVTEA